MMHVDPVTLSWALADKGMIMDRPAASCVCLVCGYVLRFPDDGRWRLLDWYATTASGEQGPSLNRRYFCGCVLGHAFALYPLFSCCIQLILTGFGPCDVLRVASHLVVAYAKLDFAFFLHPKRRHESDEEQPREEVVWFGVRWLIDPPLCVVQLSVASSILSTSISSALFPILRSLPRRQFPDSIRSQQLAQSELGQQFILMPHENLPVLGSNPSLAAEVLSSWTRSAA